jgi:hypothetical protein
MLNLEAWMQLQELYQQGMSQSQIARELRLDRKTVRKYLKQPPGPYPQRPPRARIRSAHHGPVRPIPTCRFCGSGGSRAYTMRPNYFANSNSAAIRAAAASLPGSTAPSRTTAPGKSAPLRAPRFFPSP